jgi:uncharacterized repeat protein (TIGR03803 family)
MRAKLLPFLLAALLLTFAPSAWCAPNYKVLHAFTGGNDGEELWGSLLLDSQGNVYGTTYSGAKNGGTVFELTPERGGPWRETTLYTFCSESECIDGASSTAGLIFDALGNLYGTTALGGAYASGTAFELSPQGDGTWSESVLYSFGNQGPVAPYAGVIMDPFGNLYGTGGGYAYQLSPGSAGWTLSDLHAFTGQNGDGNGPLAGVIRDAFGKLYGTTYAGGAHGWGTVYKLTPSSGGWQEQILHSFPAFPTDGQRPELGSLVLDKAGRLYGTTEQGGANLCGDVGCGIIFRLTPGAGGQWREDILYNFSPRRNSATGYGPDAGVVLDKAGNIYGTTLYGGSAAGCGVVYKLAPAAKDKWKYTVLHTFVGSDGCGPTANLILDHKGNLYGTTVLGGTYSLGVAFELTP